MTAGRSAPPIAFGQSISLAEDTSAALLLLAQDLEGDTLTYEIVTPPAHGALAGTTPNLTYVPVANFAGVDSFTFLAQDAQGPSNVATISITVTPVNDEPVANGQAVTTGEETPLPIVLDAQDLDGDPLTYAITQEPIHGNLEGTPPNLLYRPNENYFGPDSFSYRVSDGALLSPVASVTISVMSINDPPSAEFTVAGPAANLAIWDNNIASRSEGASIVATSQSGGSTGPDRLIDDDLSSRWTSAAGQIANQSLTITLPRQASYRLTGIRLVNPTTSDAVKHFEILLSNTTDHDSSFVPVLSSLAALTNRVQEIPLPAAVDARYVRVRVIDNWGSATAVSLLSLEAIAEGLAGVPVFGGFPANVAAAAQGGQIASFTSQLPNAVAANLIDDSAAAWISNTGLIANQSVVIDLAREAAYPIARARLTGVSGNRTVRNFKVEYLAPGGSYVEIFSGTALNNTTPQEFVFPTPVTARFVRLTAINNYGDASGIGLGEFQVLPVQPSDPIASSVDAATNRPDYILDSNDGTSWMTANGDAVNQSVKFRLQTGREQVVDRVRVYANGGGSTVKDFEVHLSDTTDADAAFGLAVSGTYLNNITTQEFVVPGGPRRARFAKFVAKNAYGGSRVLVGTVQVLSPSTEGSVVSLPAALTNVARNESPALAANGAVAVAYSSSFSSATLPEVMLDHAVGLPWATVGTAGQFATIRLARRAVLDGFLVAPRQDGATTQSVKDFEVWVSDTDTDDASFTKVLTGALLNNGLAQSFLLATPVQALFVKYVPLTNFGDPTYMSTGRFDVLTSDSAGVVAASSSPAGSPAELAFDDNTATVWRTATGATTNQSVDFLLSGGQTHRIYAARITPEPGSAPRVFEILASTTTPDAAGFSVIAAGMLANSATPQDFTFPVVQAKYVRFRWIDGFSSTLAVRSLEILAEQAGGATVRGSSHAVETVRNILDVDGTAGVWSSAAGQTTDLWFTITLPGNVPIAIDRVSLQSLSSTNSPRDFEIQVSTTTTDPAAFSPALASTLRRDLTLQTFFFTPVVARHVRFIARNNHGGSVTSLQVFRVFSPEHGTVNARFIDESSALDGSVASAAWTFGDGGSSPDRDPAHAYPSAGTFQVRLTSTASTGLTGEKVRPFRVAEPPSPSLEFAPSLPKEGQSVTFIDTSDDSSGLIFREWSFGDGGSLKTSSATTAHTFADNGTFTVTLKTTNAFGLSATVTRSVTVVNVAPVATAVVSKRGLVGEPIAYTVQITDPGADPATCIWTFADGGTAAGCSANHTYTTPSDLTADPTTVSATVVVNDGDGGTATASASILLFPGRLSLLTDDTPAAIGIDWHSDRERFIATQYSAPRAYVVTATGATTAQTVPGLGTNEMNIVVSPGFAGFERGHVYYNTATPAGQIGRFRLDASGTIVDRENWAVLPNGSSYGGITFDTEGTFGNELLVVWQNGFVHRVNSLGQATQLARLTGGEAEGASVAGAGFGPNTGCLITAVRESEKIWAICPGQAPRIVVDLLGQTTGQLSWVKYVPAPGTLVFSDYTGRLLKGDPRAFGMELAGHVIATTEYQGELWDIWWDAPSATYKARLYSLAPNWAGSRFEDIAYVPAATALTPSATTLPVGQTHVVTATVLDMHGVPAPNVPLTFTVTGANPRTGTARTDAAGVATFAYVGSVAGEDQITAGFRVIKSNIATIQWTGNSVPIGTPQSVTTPEDMATAIVLAGFDPEGEVLTFTIATQPTNGTLSGTAPNLTYTPAANYSGPDSFAFTVTDTSGATSAPATVSITVTPVNDAPTPTPQSLVTDEDTPVAIVLSAVDQENEAITFAVITEPTNGTLSGAAPNLTYTPAANYNGPDSFTFSVTDASGATSAPATVSITVTPVNDAPTATPQSVTTPEDMATAILLAGFDLESEVLTFTVATQPTNGTLSGSAPSLMYTPAANYSGPDSFTFTVTDASGATSATAIVSITVMPVNDAPAVTPQSVTTPEDVATAIVLAGFDPEGEVLTFTIATQPTNGTLSGTAPNLTYTPAANYSGPDSFAFTVTDASGATSAPATVSITVTPVNDAPVANPQSITTAEDTAATIMLTGTDPENEALTFAIAAPPQQGTLSGAAPNLTYTPNANYHGPDSFTFTVTDASGATSAPATVSITVTPVNDAPTATPQSVTTPEDVATAILLAGFDLEGEALTFPIATQPTNGTLSGSAPNLTYTPAANYSGPDSFTFTVTDVSGATSAIAVVSITVTLVNDSPSATPQSVTTTEDTEVAIALTGFDPENQPFLFSVTTQPAIGTLSGTAPNLTYTPAANYSGPDSFTFTITDASGATSAPATVSITVTPVNDAPTPTPQSLVTDEDTPVSIVLSAVDQENEAITFAVITEPTNGALSGAAPNLTYTPAANFAGSDAFTFAVTDATGATSALATVSITVTPLNDSPTAAPQSVATAEDTPIPIEIQALDTDHPTGLTFAITAPPQHGTLSGAAPNLTYTPASGYFGPDSFDFQATDPEGAASQTATVNLTVTPVNDAPTAMQQSVATPEDTPAAIVLAGSDPENEALTYTIVTEPVNGALSGVAPNLTYTPAPDYAGADAFTFTVADASGAVSAAATVSITMTPVNDAPTATPLSMTTPQNTPIAVVLQASDVDDPTGLTLAIITPPQHGTLSGTAPNLIYTPVAGYSGPDTFVFRATDPAGASSALTTVEVTVTPMGGNTPPVCSAATSSASVWPPNHQMVPVSIFGVIDPEGGALALAALSVFQDEPVEGSGDGSTSPDATLSPLAIRSERKGNGNGRVYTINFRATDPQGASCTGIVKVCVPKSQSGKGSTCVDDGPTVGSTGGAQ